MIAEGTGADAEPEKDPDGEPDPDPDAGPEAVFEYGSIESLRILGSRILKDIGSSDVSDMISVGTSMRSSSSLESLESLDPLSSFSPFAVVGCGADTCIWPVDLIVTRDDIP